MERVRLSQVAWVTLCLVLLARGLAGEVEDASLAERQFQKAMDIRGRREASLKQLKNAASLLKAAAGVNVVAPGAEPLENVLLASNASQEIYPGIHVANETHTGALMQLFVIYSQEGQGLPYNPRASFELLKHAASLGSPEAQSELGLILASGLYPGSDHRLLFELGEPRWPEALLHLYFAAAGNDSVAQMALGYRHMHGLGVQKSCQAAALYYQAAAERVVELAKHPHNFPRIERIRLSKQAGRGPTPTREQELLHYQWFADMGYVDAQRAVGRLLSQSGMELADQALRYFRRAAEADDPDAMAYLGHMYAGGTGVKANNATAIKWFRQGSERGNPSAHYGLGYMYLMGYGLPQDYRMAIKYLTAAAEQGHPEAWFHLGTVHFHGWGVPVSLQQASTFFGMAAKAGHILAQFNLAMINLNNRRGCQTALELLKVIAERGPWSVVLQDASEAFADGLYDQSLALYLKAAESGYELAQANAAWLLSHGYGLPPGQSASAQVAAGEKPRPASAAAMKTYQRAAQQGNVEALLAIGDAHYYGRGTARDWPRAAQVYGTAAKFRNAQALFNLGFMHEYGAGMPADLHLAKRHYDKALEAQPNASVPIQAALLSLWLHSWWNSLRPYLPSALDGLWHQIFTLQVPTAPAGSYLPKATLGFNFLDRALEMSFWGFGDPEGMWPDDAEFWETCLLVGLFGCLWLVIWRRMSLRSARRRAAAAPGPPPGSPPTQAAPASQSHRSGATGPGPHTQNREPRDAGAQTFAGDTGAGNDATEIPAQAGGTGSAASTEDEEREAAGEAGTCAIAEEPAAATMEDVVLEIGREGEPEEVPGVDAGRTTQQLQLLEGDLRQRAESAGEQPQAACWDGLKEGLGSNHLSGRLKETICRMPQQACSEALDRTAYSIDQGSCSRPQQGWPTSHSADSSENAHKWCHKTSAQLKGQEERDLKDAETCVRCAPGACSDKCLQAVWHTPTLLTGSWEKHLRMAYSLPLARCAA